ncbi:MAG: hypothetical protein CVV27_12900 [Candidatus Melainabacteria bacterium HGW-Melainabacteria-1]|nr:MAG: hypothetical protein CVV27_12900 [Candidatus Melainabacteria bacterium HGW-Melainabacteria-1]
MGRNYSFLLFGRREYLPQLLRAVAAMAAPPQAEERLLLLDGQQIAVTVDATADKNPAQLQLDTGSSVQLTTWLNFELSGPTDPAERFIREHWADFNQELLAAGRFRFSLWIEITLSETRYELGLISPLSSGSMIFSFSPGLQATVQSLLTCGAAFGLFDSEQDTFKLIPFQPAPLAQWHNLHLSFQEEDLILHSDRSGSLDPCIAMLKQKIQALPDSARFLPSESSAPGEAG